MYSLRETKRRILASNWKQLLPSCCYAQCSTRQSWSGMLHRTSGIRFNDGEWYCSAKCLESALHDLLFECFHRQQSPTPIRTTLPMGLMMLKRDLISEEQLQIALDVQRTSEEKIGACMQKLGYVSFDDIASVVATQWGCPIFPAESVQAGSSMLIPLPLIERYRMVPVHLVSQGQRLFVAFCGGVHYSALIAIEQMLHCKTEACIISEPKLTQVLEYRKRDIRNEIAVSRPKSPLDTATIICSYAQQTCADSMRMCTMDGNIWVRYMSRRLHLDLIFEHSRS